MAMPCTRASCSNFRFHYKAPPPPHFFCAMSIMMLMLMRVLQGELRGV